MASHYIAIAKASFAAALLRPDPTSVGRDEIGRFHNLLDEAMNKCTPSNIQNCKVWLSTNVVDSPGRTTAFGKYLSALSTSLGKPSVPNSSQKPDAALPVTPAAEKSTLKKKRLHLLYLLNDVLHHAKYHMDGTSAFSCFTSYMQPQMINLFILAASFDRVKHSKHHTKLEDLLRLWQEQTYYARDVIIKLQETVKNTSQSETNGSEVIQASQARETDGEPGAPPKKDQVFVMPATHGDISIPYYDLPVGNMIPHIITNSTRPINQYHVKPYQFAGGPVKETLVDVVKDLLKQAEFIYGIYDEGVVVDIDEMGQPMLKDDKSGELMVIDSYYGWSTDFCERMMKRKGGSADMRTRDTGRGRSASRSNSKSASPHKRRRYSSSGSRRDRSRSVKGFRSYNRSRSRSPRNEYHNGSGHSESQSDSKARSSSNHHRQRSYSPPGATRPSFLPQQLSHLASYQNSNAPLHTPAAQIDNPIPSQAPGAPVAPLPSTYNHNFPVGPGGLPIPPPPPFHTGPWPPPPPNIPAGMVFSPAPYPGVSTIGFVAPPPPPPLSNHNPYGSGAAHGHGQWQGQGRGGGVQGQWDGGNSGRSGYGNWDSREIGRDGGGRGGWDQGNISRGGGSQEHWNRGHMGRGGGNWRANQNSKRYH